MMPTFYAAGDLPYAKSAGVCLQETLVSCFPPRTLKNTYPKDYRASPDEDYEGSRRADKRAWHH